MLTAEQQRQRARTQRRIHPCTLCGQPIPPSSLRYCTQCRTLLAQLL